MATRSAAGPAVIVDPYSSGALYAPAFRAAGVPVIALQTAAAPPAVYAASYRPEDFSEILVAGADPAAAIARLQALAPRCVLAGCESGVELAERVAPLVVPATANLPELAAARRHKGAMAEAVARAGLPIIEQICTDDADAVEGWLTRTGLRGRDLVIKPPKSASTDGVTRVPGGVGWREVFASMLGRENRLGLVNDRLVVQEYCRGVEYVIDTASMHGVHSVSDICRYHKIDNGTYMAVYESMAWMPPTIPEYRELVDYATGVLDAVGMRCGAAHIELMLTEQGPRLIELGARPHGGGHPRFCKLATGDSQLDRVVRCFATGAPLPPSYELAQHVRVMFFVARQSGYVTNAQAMAGVGELATHHFSKVAVRDGAWVEATKDLFGSLDLGFVVLAHPERSRVEADAARVRELERALAIVPAPPREATLQAAASMRATPEPARAPIVGAPVAGALLAAWLLAAPGAGAALAAPGGELAIDVPPRIDRVEPAEPDAPTGSAARPALQAARADRGVRLDGVLDDAVWATAAASEAFTQTFPNDGQRPSERTTLRAAYDEAALYVAFDCDQEHTPIIARLARRDRDVGADRVEVSVGDGARTFSFWVSASGVVGDGIRFNDTDYSADWDGVWEARVSPRVGGWAAELRLPLSLFRVAATTGAQDWAIQARRFVPARQETVEWAYAPRTVAGEVSRYGKLTGLVGLRAGRPVELRPFVVARGARDRAGATAGATAGLDARWRITQSLGLDVAINPDFAQVEADEQALNLTTFETFFPEKRPFFLDGMDLFQLPRMAYFPSGQGLFYTRRVGAVPDEPATGGRVARVLEAPAPVTIYGAAKLRGTLGDGIAGSVLSAVTGRGDQSIERADGSRGAIAAAPVTWYNVVRARAAVTPHAQVGVLATATTRFEEPSGYPRDGEQAPGMQQCPAGAEIAAGARCFHDSYVASADGHWRSSSGDYVVSGQGIVSAIAGGPPRTLLDGTVIAAGDAGVGGSVFAAKEGGAWLGSLEVEAAGRTLDYNDLGYMQRQNQIRLLPTVEYRAMEPVAAVAESRVRLSASLRDTLAGLPLWRGYYAFTEWKLKRSWTLSTLAYYLGRRFDDREVGDGTAVERAGGLGWDVAVSSDPSARVSAGLASELVLHDAGHEMTGTAQVDMHVLPQLELHLQGQATSTKGEVRFLEAGARPDEYLFGKLDARSVGLTLRANYTLTTRLTIQLYTRALLIAKEYYDYQAFTSTAARPRIRLAALTPVAPPESAPASELATLDVNAVLRWEPRPGSAVFVVYTRAQTPAETELGMGERPRLDLGALRGGAASDALLVKLSYWWN